MLNNLTNIFNLITGKKIKQAPANEDIIVLGTKDLKYTGKYKPTAVTYNSLKNDIISNIPSFPTNTQLREIVLGTPDEIFYVEVPITSAQILSMGTNPIELVSAQGVGTYFQASIIIESTAGATPYNFGAGNKQVTVKANAVTLNIQAAFFNAPLGGTYTFELSTSSPNIVDSVGSFTYQITDLFGSTNLPITLTTLDGVDPIDGDGTALAKIWYRVRTIGSEL